MEGGCGVTGRGTQAPRKVGSGAERPPPLVGPSGELEKVLAGEGSVSGLDHQITQEAHRGLGGLFCFLVEKNAASPISNRVQIMTF